MCDSIESRYVGLAKEYERLWSPVIKPMGLRLVEMVPLGSSSSVVDIGCGTGNLTAEIAAAAPSGIYVGLDRSADMLEIAAKCSGKLLHADACNLPFRSSVFDVAIMSFVVFKFPSPAAGLAEARRVLRAGGVLGLTIWQGDSHNLPGDEIWDQVLTDLPKSQDEADQLESLNEVEKLDAVLEGAGFTPFEIHAETFDFTWTSETLLALKSELTHRARLSSLPIAERARRLALVRAHLDGLPPDSLAWRPSILFALCRAEPE